MTDERHKPVKRDNAEQHRRLRLSIHDATSFVLVGPHYPENVGAAARAIKTMGFYKLVLVRPSRLAFPEHEMAQKMAVKSWDVLDSAKRFEHLADAVKDIDFVVATTARPGISRVVPVRDAARDLVERATEGGSIAILFGNEKSGLSDAELTAARIHVRIPMAANQPSVNLAQAAQLVAYELFVAALERT
jgi:TrmH family RNA methyltransferase